MLVPLVVGFAVFITTGLALASEGPVAAVLWAAAASAVSIVLTGTARILLFWKPKAEHDGESPHAPHQNGT